MAPLCATRRGVLHFGSTTACTRLRFSSRPSRTCVPFAFTRFRPLLRVDRPGSEPGSACDAKHEGCEIAEWSTAFTGFQGTGRLNEMVVYGVHRVQGARPLERDGGQRRSPQRAWGSEEEHWRETTAGIRRTPIDLGSEYSSAVAVAPRGARSCGRPPSRTRCSVTVLGRGGRRGSGSRAGRAYRQRAAESRPPVSS